ALTVTAISTESDGSTAEVAAPLTVSISAVADAPIVQVANAAGNENSAIALDNTAMVAQGGEQMSSVTNANLPEGAVLAWRDANGDDQSFTASAGQTSVTIDWADFSQPSVTPPVHDDRDFSLDIAVSAIEGDTQATSHASLQVQVQAVAD